MAKTNTIYINCSEVAAAIGMNKFKSPEEVAKNILLHQFPDDVADHHKLVDVADLVEEVLASSDIYNSQIEVLAKEKMSSTGGGSDSDSVTVLEKKIVAVSEELTKTIEVAVVEKFTNSPAEKKLPLRELIEREKKALTSSSSNSSSSSGLDVEKITEMKNILKQLEAAEFKTKLEKTVARSVSMKTGVLAEESIVDAVAEEVGKEVKERNCTIKYRSISVPSTTKSTKTKWRILIGGKPDGLVYGDSKGDGSGNPQVVEVKNRQKRLFRSVPEYEVVQVQIYMWLFRVVKCQFREQYHNQSWSTVLDFDQRMINMIQEKLIDFAQHYILPSMVERENY